MQNLTTISPMTSYPSSPFIWYDPVLGHEMQRNMINQQSIPTSTHSSEYQIWLENELKNRLQAQAQVNTRPIRQTRQPSWFYNGNYYNK